MNGAPKLLQARMIFVTGLSDEKVAKLRESSAWLRLAVA